MNIRAVQPGDAAAIAAIYAPFVSGTAVTFEEIPPDGAEMARRIADTTRAYPWLVTERDGCILGYAYASQHRTRAAYRTSVDVTCYVAEGFRRQGVGLALYRELLKLAGAAGYHAAFAGIALPNDASVAMHAAAGFTPVGVYREVGYKLGRWLDVAWYQRLL